MEVSANWALNILKTINNVHLLDTSSLYIMGTLSHANEREFGLQPFGPPVSYGVSMGPNQLWKYP